MTAFFSVLITLALSFTGISDFEQSTQQDTRDIIWPGGTGNFDSDCGC